MIALILLVGTPAWAQRASEPVRLEGTEILISGMDHIGRRVTLTLCHVKGDAVFDPFCNIANQADRPLDRTIWTGFVMLDRRTLARDDFRKILNDCPPMNVNDGCWVSVEGTVRRYASDRVVLQRPVITWGVRR